MTVTAAVEAPARRPRLWSRLYRGETSFDFVGRRRQWFAISGVVIIVGMAALGILGLNFGIDFKGGTSWQVPASNLTVAQARSALGPVGRNATIVTLGSGANRTLQVQAELTGSAASQAASKTQVSDTLARLAHVQPGTVSLTDVGPTWGGEITNKAIEALIVFFVAIGLYITIRFEWKMAVSALVAVFHDLVVTVGIYALVGFPVTPATVVAVLTILGYSLYDTIVVFDRVHENTRGLGSTGRLTYADTVNLSMNQVLMRSLNTSIVAILPILSILVIGAELLGATTLQEFGLALVIGLTTGAYSSIFIASPLLAMLKEREPRYLAIRRKLEARGEASLLLTPAAAAAMASAGSGGSSRPGPTRPVRGPKGGAARARRGGPDTPARADTPVRAASGAGAPAGTTGGADHDGNGNGRAPATEGLAPPSGEGQPVSGLASPSDAASSDAKLNAGGQGAPEDPKGGATRPKLRPPPAASTRRPPSRPRKKGRRR